MVFVLFVKAQTGDRIEIVENKMGLVRCELSFNK